MKDAKDMSTEELLEKATKRPWPKPEIVEFDGAVCWEIDGAVTYAAEVDAEIIYRAVNSFEAMREALMAIRLQSQNLRQLYPDSKSFLKIIDRHANAALSLSEPKSKGQP